MKETNLARVNTPAMVSQISENEQSKECFKYFAIPMLLFWFITRWSYKLGTKGSVEAS